MGQCRLLDFGITVRIEVISGYQKQNFSVPVVFCSRCLVIRIPNLVVCGKSCNCIIDNNSQTLLCYQSVDWHGDYHACSHCRRFDGHITKNTKNELESLAAKIMDIKHVQNPKDQKPFVNEILKSAEEEELCSLALVPFKQKQALQIHLANSLAKAGIQFQMYGSAHNQRTLQYIEIVETSSKKRGLFSSKTSCSRTETQQTSENDQYKSVHNQFVTRAFDNNLCWDNQQKLLQQAKTDYYNLDVNSQLWNSDNNNINSNRSNKNRQKKEMELWDAPGNPFSKQLCARGEHFGIILADAELFFEAAARNYKINNSMQENSRSGVFVASPIIFCRKCGLATRMLADSPGDLKIWMQGNLKNCNMPQNISGLVPFYQNLQLTHESYSETNQGLTRVASDEILQFILDKTQHDASDNGVDHRHIFGDVSFRLVSMQIIQKKNLHFFQQIQESVSKRRSLIVVSIASQTQSLTVVQKSTFYVLTGSTNLVLFDFYCSRKGCYAHIGPPKSMQWEEAIQRIQLSSQDLQSKCQFPAASAIRIESAAKNISNTPSQADLYPLFVAVNEGSPIPNSDVYNKDLIVWLQDTFYALQDQPTLKHIIKIIKESDINMKVGFLANRLTLASWELFADDLEISQSEPLRQFWLRIKAALEPLVK